MCTCVNNVTLCFCLCQYNWCPANYIVIHREQGLTISNGDTFVCLVKLLMLAMKFFLLFDFSFSRYYNHEVAFH